MKVLLEKLINFFIENKWVSIKTSAEIQSKHEYFSSWSRTCGRV